MIEETEGKSSDRKSLFKELVRELKAHAAAEEQALWSTVLRDPETTDFARHAISEHKEIDDMLADLAARDMASSGWLRRLGALKEEYFHHIREEDTEQIGSEATRLSAADVHQMQPELQPKKTSENDTQQE